MPKTDNPEVRQVVSTLAPFIYVVTDEPGRFLKWLHTEYSSKKRHDFRVWKQSLGRKTLAEYIGFWDNVAGARLDTATSDPNTFLAGLLTEPTPDGRLYTVMLGAEKTILSGRDPMLSRRLEDLAEQCQMNRQAFKSLIFVGHTLQIPAGMERMFRVVYFDLPTVADHKAMLDGILSSDHLSRRLKGPVNTQDVAEAMAGMTHYEAEQCALASLAQFKMLTAAHVRLAKREVIKKNPLLELVNPNLTFEDVGGMGALKKYLDERNGSWLQEAKDYGLPRFKGVMQVGLPGNGKSLICKAIASRYGLPLIKFDPARLFGGQVGQSESNMRRALNTMESMAPCIVWIDEIEKGLAGMQSSSFSDSGTTARVIGTFLNWMQECEDDVILMATANNITELPPELLRRFDEIFFVGLPEEAQRKQIWEIQIRAKGRDPADFDLDALVQASPTRSGSEIEGAVGSALFTAYSDGKRGLSTEDLVNAVRAKPSLLVTMREQLEGIIEWVGKDEETGDGVRARFAHAVDSGDSFEVE